MYLLNTTTLELKKFMRHNPKYAILSHRWLENDEEVSFQDMQSGKPRKKAGYDKLTKCCAQALKDGYEWVWIDTCCIDKTSSEELSEGINSMFRWYQDSAVCYAYLADFHPSVEYPMRREEHVDQFKSSDWFNRGWTLQELIAPPTVAFFGNYKNTWMRVGTKADLSRIIATRTGIDEESLTGGNIQRVSVAKRMSWASMRQTTREEDMAYCLLGIFDVNMPLLYGEGKKAFLRLQEEILKKSDDHSLFAWKPRSSLIDNNLVGLLAPSPGEFVESGDIETFPDRAPGIPYSLTNRGLRIRLPIVQLSASSYVAILSCGYSDRYFENIGIDLQRLGAGDGVQYARDTARQGGIRSVPPEFFADATKRIIFIKQEPDVSAARANQFFIRLNFQGAEAFEPFFVHPAPSTYKLERPGTTRGIRHIIIPRPHTDAAVYFCGPNGQFVVVLFRATPFHHDAQTQPSCSIIYSDPLPDSTTSSELASTAKQRAMVEFFERASLVPDLKGERKHRALEHYLEKLTKAQKLGHYEYILRLIAFLVLHQMYPAPGPERRAPFSFADFKTPAAVIHYKMAHIGPILPKVSIPTKPASHLREMVLATTSTRSFRHMADGHAVSAEIERRHVRGEQMYVVDITFYDQDHIHLAPVELSSDGGISPDCEARPTPDEETAGNGESKPQQKPWAGFWQYLGLDMPAGGGPSQA